MNVNYPIIDADGHVLEKDASCTIISTDATVKRPAFETYSLFSFARWLESRLRRSRKRSGNPGVAWLEFLDELGVHTTVLYPTGGFALGLGPESGVGLRPRARLQFLARRPLHQAKSAA